MATGRLINTGYSGAVVLTEASITGSDPSAPTQYQESKPGDIVHTRNGRVISVRSWAVGRKFTVKMMAISLATLSSLRLLYNERVVIMQPIGTTSGEVRVHWKGDFTPEYINPTTVNLTINLEEVI